MKLKFFVKSITLIIAIIISNKSMISQNNVSSNYTDRLTEVMLQKKYSSQEIEELKNNPEKLKTLNYLFSKSFEVSQHQTYTKEQFEKIDILIYDTQRKLDDRVLVFDEASGLSIILYSLKQIENDTKTLSKSVIFTSNPSDKNSN